MSDEIALDSRTQVDGFTSVARREKREPVVMEARICRQR
jgi:hypothetical protein